jgi:hypothetical protein
MFGIKENHIDEERVIFLQLWIEVVRDEGDWKSGRSLILVLFISSSRSVWLSVWGEIEHWCIFTKASKHSTVEI